MITAVFGGCIVMEQHRVEVQQIQWFVRQRGGDCGRGRFCVREDGGDEDGVPQRHE